jgi:hypothetical protein
MSISAKFVRFDENYLWVELSDGRTLGVPLAGQFEKSQLCDVFASLKTDGPARTLEVMDAAVIEEARKNAGD